MSLRILIASDDEQTGQRLCELLERHALECPASRVVSLDVAADRASRLIPELILFVLSDDPMPGLKALRETQRTLSNAHILAVGPATDAKLVLKALHVGAAEYLDLAMLESELANSLIRWKTRQQQSTKRQASGRVLAVLAPSGGCGGSTLAVNLSTVLAYVGTLTTKAHGECGLIDLNLAAGDLEAMLNLKPLHGLGELCDRIERMDQTMFEQFLVKHASGVHLLAAPRELNDIEKVTGKVIRRVLAMARVRFPYTVIDVANAFDIEQVEALWQADTILVVMRLDYTSLRNTRRALDNLVDLGIGLERVRLVVNGYRQAKQLRLSEVEKALDMKVLECVPNDPSRVNRSINKGIPVVLHSPRAPFSKSIMDLAAAVNGHHGEPWSERETES